MTANKSSLLSGTPRVLILIFFIVIAASGFISIQQHSVHRRLLLADHNHEDGSTASAAPSASAKLQNERESPILIDNKNNNVSLRSQRKQPSARGGDNMKQQRRRRLPLDIRSGQMRLGKSVSPTEWLFNNLSSLCGAAPGIPRCSRSLSVDFTLTKEKRTRGSSSGTSFVVDSSNSHENNHGNNNNNHVDNDEEEAVASRGCCCSWTPVVRSCTGLFNATNPQLLQAVRLSHFFHSPTSRRGIPAPKVAARVSCPWFDRGFWNLPDDFLSLSFDEAAEASARASAAGQPVGADAARFQKLHRQNIGPLLVWRLAREVNGNNEKDEKNNKDNNNNNNNNNNKNRNRRPSSSSSSSLSSTPMIIFAGDSLIRQVFKRLVHMIRSRECSDTHEMFRGGVFERYFHMSAAYVVTTRGDALRLGFDACEKMARSDADAASFVTASTFSSNSSSSTAGSGGGGGGEKVLLKMCYVWDPKADVSETLAALKSISQTPTRVSALLYWPTIHQCVHAVSKELVRRTCAASNVTIASVRALMDEAKKMMMMPSTAAAAGEENRSNSTRDQNSHNNNNHHRHHHHHRLRLVIGTNLVRQWYPAYAMEKILDRNQKLRDMFSSAVSQRDMARLLSERIVNRWTRRNSSSLLPKNQTLFSTIGRKGTPEFDFRLYDFATRHAQVRPRQCDHGHSMCMFWPLRTSPSARLPVNGLTGVCPNGSRCEDPWDFLFAHEMLALLMA